MKESVQNLPFHGDAKPEAILIREGRIYSVDIVWYSDIRFIPYIFSFISNGLRKKFSCLCTKYRRKEAIETILFLSFHRWTWDQRIFFWLSIERNNRKSLFPSNEESFKKKEIAFAITENQLETNSSIWQKLNSKRKKKKREKETFKNLKSSKPVYPVNLLSRKFE